jgi:dUTP pyrophosphatase
MDEKGDQQVKVKIKRLTGTARIPAYQTDGSAGMDLCSDDDPRRIYDGETRAIGTGLAIAVPVGFEAQVRSRSGMAAKGIVVANSPGTIDSDYRGEVKVLLRNCSDGPIDINRGDRIAQLVIAPVVRADLQDVSDLDETARGAGGFGHTGTR